MSDKNKGSQTSGNPSKKQDSQYDEHQSQSKNSNNNCK
jgi:hypothetical protein